MKTSWISVLLLDMRQKGIVGPHHILHGLHPDLPDPLSQVRTVLGAAHSQEQVSELSNLDIELCQGLVELLLIRILGGVAAGPHLRHLAFAS